MTNGIEQCNNKAMAVEEDTVKEAAHQSNVFAPTLSAAGPLEQDANGLGVDHASGTRVSLGAGCP